MTGVESMAQAGQAGLMILKTAFQDRIVPSDGFVKMYYFVPEKSDKVVANSFDVR
jgi:hypothetical protein